MTISAPPTLTDLPATPDRNAKGTFNTRVVAMFDMLKATAIGEWRAMMSWIESAAADAASSAATAATQASNSAGSAVDAQTAAGVALGAANFKGNWVSLSGALNKPACVKYNGRFWLLVNNLANVASSTPSDANTDWVSMDAGASPSAVITTNTPAVVGVRYRIAGACTLTLPTSGLLRGDFIGWALMDGVTGAYVDFGATKCQGRDVGLMSLDIPRDARSLYYEDTTRGMCQ